MDIESLQNLLDKPIPNTIIVQETIAPVKEDMDYVTRTTITELNAYYLMNGKYQSLDHLKIQVPEITSLSETGLKDLFTRVNNTLENKRNLPPFQIKFRVVKTFDPAFITACQVLSDVSDRRPVGSKLKEIGMTTRRWNNFLKLKKNKDYWAQIVDNLMDNEVYHEGRMALAKNVLEGDLPSFKYFNELTGKFVQQRDFDPRIISVLMNTVLDIVIRHVDPNIARLIADEMDQAAISTLTGLPAIPISPPHNPFSIEV